MRRLEDLLWPPKGKAALRAFLWFVAAILVLMICPALGYQSDGVASLFTLAAVCGAFFTWVWFHKFNRDRKLADRAERERTAQTTFEYNVTPQRTTPGSERISLTPHRPPESV